jgi:hypothetical protein
MLMLVAFPAAAAAAAGTAALQATCRDANLANTGNQQYSFCPSGTVNNLALVNPPTNLACCQVIASACAYLQEATGVHSRTCFLQQCCQVALQLCCQTAQAV